LLTVIALFAVSSLRQSNRIEGSLSLIIHLRTNTCASWNDLIRTGLARSGKFASNTASVEKSLIDLSFRAVVQPFAHAELLLSLDNAVLCGNLLAPSER
jgi:hypothetical protein